MAQKRPLTTTGAGEVKLSAAKSMLFGFDVAPTPLSSAHKERICPSNARTRNSRDLLYTGLEYPLTRGPLAHTNRQNNNITVLRSSSLHLFDCPPPIPLVLSFSSYPERLSLSLCTHCEKNAHPTATPHSSKRKSTNTTRCCYTTQQKQGERASQKVRKGGGERILTSLH